MKTTFLLFLMVLSSAFAKAQLPTFNTAVKELLSTHVNSGKVDYASIKKSPQSLNTAVEALKKIQVDQLTGAERKAVLINAYNVFTIQGVIKSYPTSSVMKVSNFFDAKNYQLGDRTISLNQLEKEVLFNEFPDARLHFALVCGAVSCPPLMDKPFTAENLEFMLKKLTKAAINNPKLVQLDMHEKKAIVSKIFDWYQADFTKTQSLIDYLNKYREQGIPDGFSVEFMNYDWSLNDK